MSETRKTSVLGCDDDLMVAMSIEEAINQETDMSSLGFLHSNTELMKEIEEKKPDIVVLDISMPGKSSLEVLAEIDQAHPNVKCIVFSGYSDQKNVDQAVGAGAWGYVVKSADIHDLIDAIRHVAEGKFVLP